MRAASDSGVLLYWPPHEGILYSPAGPVSRQVPIVLTGTLAEFKAAEKLLEQLERRGYQTTERKVKEPPAEQSVPIPDPGELIRRPTRVKCRGCGDLVEKVNDFCECPKCSAEWDRK